jgi:cell division protein ZipA
MMHNAARKLAEEFKAEILDDSRCTLTQQGLQQYVERIRDFERRRLLGQ